MSTAITALFTAAISLAVAVWAFNVNVYNRHTVDQALGGVMNVPERVVPWYGAHYLNAFIATARARETSEGRSALSVYCRPTLVWLDIVFAVFFALFAATFWLGLLCAWNTPPIIAKVMCFFAAMAALYGVADVAEDVWLYRLLTKDAPVTTFEGVAASVLTQTKIASLTLSGVGGITFLVLQRMSAPSTK